MGGMTAEVAVMNQTAVALAADSLATVDSGGSRKTYQVNKLFTLSKHHPVGVMVFDSAELLLVPLETIIKTYRRALGRKSFATIQEYAEHLFDYLGNATDLFPEELQNGWYRVVLSDVFGLIDQQIDAAVKREIGDTASGAPGSASDSEIRRIIGDTIRTFRLALEAAEVRAYLPGSFAETLENTRSPLISDEIDECFTKKNKPLSTTDLRNLRWIAANVLVRDWPLDTVQTGVVIAGFGDSETFPTVRTYIVHGIVNNVPIYDPSKSETVPPNRDHRAVLPFAQRDVVDTFLGGMDSEDREFLRRALAMFFGRLPGIITDCMDSSGLALLPELRDKFSKSMQEATKNIPQEFVDHVRQRLRKKHVEPLVDVLEFLPKEELAALAESLVSLTSVKRKLSMEIETVGGPIDVAIISKGDGFVWVKRKYYFDPKFNHAFLDRYFER